jgi:DNA-directed RNA polymerase I and III subunit RPAC2
MPHPSEAKMNLRIQTFGTYDGPVGIPPFLSLHGRQVLTLLNAADSTNVFAVLEKGLNDLMDLCDVVTEKFTLSRDSFEANKMQ